jgi:hypothetical protein
MAPTADAAGPETATKISFVYSNPADPCRLRGGVSGAARAGAQAPRPDPAPGGRGLAQGRRQPDPAYRRCWISN